MQYKWILFGVLLLLQVFASAQINIESIYNDVQGSTVYIDADIQEGSGFFIGDSLIITNNHVVVGAKRALITIGGTDSIINLDCIVAQDPSKDLALLKVGHFGKALTLDTGELHVGQDVITIGSPMRIKNIVTTGILSGVRNMNGMAQLIYTAQVSGGNSGGPLLNDNGAVIGIVTGKIPNTGLNVAPHSKYIQDFYVKNRNLGCNHKPQIITQSGCKLTMHEIQENAMLMIKHLGSYISIICNKEETETERNKSKEYALGLFINQVVDNNTTKPRTPIIEVSSKNSKTPDQWTIDMYFGNLEQLGYSETRIEWTDAVPLGDCKTGPDGTIVCSFIVKQVFKGLIDGRIVYEDITEKRIEVIVKECSTTINGEKVTQCCVKLGDIYVESTN